MQYRNRNPRVSDEPLTPHVDDKGVELAVSSNNDIKNLERSSI